ncbi:DMT family transporter [Leptolyngbya sp. FACHB-261]|uniref:DMT family transporter n=1 Tax=Leptolyngbya sp. FACHB-261 TaxID=2692806 RepID=UPI001682D09A|nr:DMT family transporter [Leptolyngbya sp. FACHB-261]MBD2101361.1 DMT family transporter [Leptolyngbya sp. FACHB-261]
MPTKPPAWTVGLVLTVAIFAISTAAIFTRLAFAAADTEGVGISLVLAGSRLILAALLVLPAWRHLHPGQLAPGALRYAVLAGICLAVHFATWITSLAYTSIAASTTLVTTNPVWVTLLSWLWLREKPTALTLLGISVALSGGVLLGWGDAGTAGAGSNPLLGDFLALVGSWAISLHLLLGREAQQRGLGLAGYTAVTYSTAAVVLAPLPLAVGASYVGYPSLVYVYILLIALLPQVVGHTSINWAVRWVSPILVTLAILFEPVGSTLLAYWFFAEVPGLLVLIGAVILLIGVAIAIVGTRQGSQSSFQNESPD